MTDIFQVLCHVRKLIGGDNLGMHKFMCVKVRTKCNVTTLEQNGSWNTHFLMLKGCIR